MWASSKLTIAGTIFLALGICCSLFVIGDVLFGETVALVFALATLVLIGALWYALPISRRRDGSAT